mmetsp:Transcript_38141/g.36506  ORF Transcript_38141/g.36506 Transcript_38141/m.36506 type:complete len:126 (-) Transcript_38141:1312-1689(-)
MLDIGGDALKDLLALNALLLIVLDLKDQLPFFAIRDWSDFVQVTLFTVLVEVGAKASEAFLLNVDSLVVEAFHILLGVGVALLLGYLHGELLGSWLLLGRLLGLKHELSALLILFLLFIVARTSP